MKKLGLYFILAIFCNCQSQEISKQDILGNWYPEYSAETLDSYFEFYISNDKIFYINDIGWLPSKNYSIKDNILYIEDFNEQGESYMKKQGRISMDSGKMILEISKDVSFIRLNSSPNLGDCINGKFDANKLLSFVLERQAEWKKNK